MNSKVIKEELFNRKSHPISYLVKRQEDSTTIRVIQSSSAMFYISMTVLIFLCLGVFLNIALEMQSINYKKKIFETDKLITLEKERSDRLQLKITELRSPARIMSKAENELGMKISDNIKIMQIAEVSSQNNSKINYSIENDPGSDLKKYDNFLGKIYGLEGIIMVVSEGVLTFFMP
jgi:cell division protein FtsL